MMSIHTVAAGGGSILHFDGARYRVGPDSAGADPGPASYRRGGPQADQPLDRETVSQQFAQLAQRISETGGKTVSAEQAAAGFIQVAVGNMANAIKKISVQRGHDVTRYALATFGGAGGQHACAVADALGMKTVFIHPLAGVLSAYGMGLADQIIMRESSLETRLDAGAHERIDAALARLEQDALQEASRQGIAPERIALIRRVHLRYEGTDSALAVPFDSVESMRTQYEAAYRKRFSFLMPGKALIVETVSVEAVGAADAPPEENAQTTGSRAGALVAAERVPMFVDDKWREAPLYQRDDCCPGDAIIGPAIIAEAHATTVVEPGWCAEVNSLNHLILRRSAVLPRRAAAGIKVEAEADPVMLEIFNNLFMAIAEQMGVTLQQTAYSVNIKERLDFSCALFDSDGNLIANAPHMPVHLGSMGESIRAVIYANSSANSGVMRAGDVYMLNDPYHGGTHLPDVTVVTPVFDDSKKNILFYVASRGHHADIGGSTPGSMPPDSSTIEEEGVLIDNFKLVVGGRAEGRFREAELRALLTGGRYPARNPDQNVADLRAQVAANQKGVEELRKMVAQFGLPVVQAYMRHVQDTAEEAVRREIGALKDGSFALELDNGARISVSISIARATRNAESSTCISDALYGALGAMAASQGSMNIFTFGYERYLYYDTFSGGSGAG